MEEKVILKKGKYYIGDPCYIFDKSWSDILYETEYFDCEKLVRGRKCLVGGTAYGDGVYLDKQKREYWVDSGMIGILPVSLLLIDKKHNLSSVNKCDGMHIVKFEDDFEASVIDGIFTFGNIVIDTIDDGEVDEDDGYSI